MSEILEWFADPRRVALANWAVAALALVISVVAFAVSRKTQGMQGKLQARLLEIEQAREDSRQLEARKARLRAEITSREGTRTKQFHLEIRNDGEVTAHEIAAWLEDMPIMDHAAIPGGQDEIKEIGPRSTARYILAPAMGRAPPWKFRVTWQDGSGSPREYQTTLTF